MPMPTQNTPWPPPQWLPAYLAYAENNAWWTGNRKELEAVYGGNTGRPTIPYARPTRNGRQSTVGSSLRERALSFFWGARGGTRTHGAPAPIRSHLPAAANLATLSSDLQFAVPPRFLIAGEEADSKDEIAVRLRDLMDTDRARAGFNIYGEAKAALGGTITIPMWDKDIAPGEVWFETFGADTTIPEFRSGRLAAVTLWSEIREDATYWRLLSYHGVDNGVGYIEHALFMGKVDNLGRRVPLTEHFIGAEYADLVDGQSRVLTGIDRLDAVYGINAPSIEWRRDPVLRYAGRSDFAQLHGLFDDLDRTWSSWQRDLRLGVGRTFVPSAYLQNLGRGQGAAFDDVAEYVTRLDVPGDVDGGLAIHHQQHAIRVEEHLATLDATYREILRKAGYSPSSWGDHQSGGGNVTATEIEDRSAASERTRSKKNLHDRQTLSELARIVLDVDRVHFGGPGYDPKRLPFVEFPEMSQETPRDLAETVGLLDAAGAISLMQKVARSNPEWTATQVSDEVRAIRQERGLNAPDPAALGRVVEQTFNDDDDEEDLDE